MTPDGAAAVLLEDAGRRFGTVQAVARLSLRVQSGETLAVLGPSGAGKTTLLMLIAGETPPDSGRVVVEGIDLADMRPGRELARLVGMIHQQFDLVPNLSALQNVLVGRLGEWGLLRSMVSLGFPRERETALAALERVGLDGRVELRAGRLSGGEQQRVAIARLLVQDPAVVLADEPVASLDPARAGEVMDILLSVTRDAGKTLIASMHSVELARRYFERLVGLRNGQLQFDLPASDVTDGMLEELYALEGLRDAD